MNQVLQDLSTPNLVTALENNMFAFLTNYGRAPHRQLYSESNLIRFSTGISFPFFNGVCRAQLYPDQIDATITGTLNYFTAQQIPMFWWTGPATQPADLGKYLEAHGLSRLGELPVMAIDLSALAKDLSVPADLAIAQVKDHETLKHWVRVATVGFEIPDREYNAYYDLELSLGIDSKEYIRFIGWWKGLPVVTSALYLDPQVAGIYVVATIPEARRNGFATALVLTALQRAYALGYHVATLQATEMGVNVYRRIGFQEYCKTGLYLWTSQLDQNH
ncbi:MAG: GNAT family N-acetyltransferase [Nostoc sp. NOS(2021)]|uniref:GNAT family N-acetyltransferase n=1 Tax=Nostoc sp. NOS(2021) TaxID=2815407 RepID=UPI0025DCF80C|nr:GNAT family N-acetyltransferase [Nostoc sp. NOS(2021)]MBN3898107.1 GNAT family N-acetyltransferase [Nostoc sp. NOS(2021)]